MRDHFENDGRAQRARRRRALSIWAARPSPSPRSVAARSWWGRGRRLEGWDLLVNRAHSSGVFTRIEVEGEEFVGVWLPRGPARIAASMPGVGMGSAEIDCPGDGRILDVRLVVPGPGRASPEVDPLRVVLEETPQSRPPGAERMPLEEGR